MPKGAVLAFAVLRNEALRLPSWMAHHRRLGVDRFLIVDNASDDGSADWLASQPDVLLWTTDAPYRNARFGMDWLTALLWRYGHGHWCLTLDGDEFFVYAHHETRTLRALTDWLSSEGIVAMGALMLDLYPRGPLSATTCAPGDDPLAVLSWFDAGNHVVVRQSRLRNLWVQGGPRARTFFASDPRRAPTLSKMPLVRWDRRYAYVSSTHSLLPPRLNDLQPAAKGEAPTGLLLHTKFLADIGARSTEERTRRQHFENSTLYEDYRSALINDPVLWCEGSTRLTGGWRQLEALGLMSRGGWA
ncbi:MAG: glycosyltransferase family 2 protein [Pseudomonadota bacterium]